jgi:hypothetical protein
VVSGLYFVGRAGAPSVCRGGSGLYFILELYNPPGLRKQQRVGFLIHINGVYNWSIELWVHSQGPLLLTPHLQNMLIPQAKVYLM